MASRAQPSLSSLPEVLIIKIAMWLSIRDLGRLRSIMSSPAWTSEHLWSSILDRDHSTPLPYSLQGLPSELAAFLLLLTKGDEPPAIELIVLILHGSARMVSLYLQAKPPDIRDNEIVCSAALMLAERLRKLDTVAVLLSETVADGETGNKVYNDAVESCKENMTYTFPAIEKLWKLTIWDAAAKDDLDDARDRWKASKRYEERVRDKAKRRAHDEKWGLRGGKYTSSRNWEDSLLREIQTRDLQRCRYNTMVERLAYGSQRAREAVATRATLAKEKRRTMKVLQVIRGLQECHSDTLIMLSLPFDVTCIIIIHLDVQSVVRYLTTQTPKESMDYIWEILLNRDYPQTLPNGFSLTCYELYRLLYFRQYRARNPHIGPARCILEIALKGGWVVEARAALRYFTGLAENVAACSAALYICAKTDSKNNMLKLLLTETKADPESVGALHEAARRFCPKNVEDMVTHGVSSRSRASNSEEKSALWNAVTSHITKHSGTIPDEAVERTCEVLAAAAAQGDLVEVLELAVRHRDRSCVTGILKAGNYPSWYRPLSVKDWPWFDQLHRSISKSCY